MPKVSLVCPSCNGPKRLKQPKCNSCQLRNRKCAQCEVPWANLSHRFCWRCLEKQKIQKLSIKRKCRQCGKSYLGYARQSRWCSLRCYHTWKLQRRVKYCPICNKPIYGRFTYRNVACSLKCGRVLTKQKSALLTERRYRYMNGTNSWKDTKIKVRTRDGNKCVVCQKVGVRLHVDHLFPFRLVRSWGGDPNDLVNLNSLCILDHAAKTHVEQKLIRGNAVAFVSGIVGLGWPKDKVRSAAELYGLSEIVALLDRDGKIA